MSVLCAGGQRRPRVSAGASAAGSVAVASRPRGRNTADAPAALDGPTGQPGVFPQRAELLGQVTDSTCFQSHC